MGLDFVQNPVLCRCRGAELCLFRNPHPIMLRNACRSVGAFQCHAFVMYEHVCMCVYVCACMYVCTCMCVCMCMYVCMYMIVHVCMLMNILKLNEMLSNVRNMCGNLCGNHSGSLLILDSSFIFFNIGICTLVMINKLQTNNTEK